MRVFTSAETSLSAGLRARDFQRQKRRNPAANQNIPDFSVRKCNACEIAKDSASAMVAGRPS
jgi:hypothetical protein